jgi:hypothetical protein
MSRTNKTGRNTGESRHVRLYYWLMQTVAWRSLDATARAIYVEMASRYGGPGSNNGRIPYSVREAAESLRIGKTTAARALERLQQRGFIVAMKKGAFSLKLRHATEWRLTEFPCDMTHVLPTKEFTRWSPEIQNTVPPQTQMVPVAAPLDTSGGTGVTKMSRNGTRSGTASAFKRRSSVPVAGH